MALIAQNRISDSALKSCITTLYVDVKEPAVPGGTRLGWTPESLLLPNLKTVVVASFPKNGGRDRIRTCDPALIKRML